MLTVCNERDCGPVASPVMLSTNPLEHSSQIYRRPLANLIKIAGKPDISSPAANAKKVGEKIPFGIQFA